MGLIILPDGSIKWVYEGQRQPTLTDKQCDSLIAHFFDVFIFFKAAFIIFMSIKGTMMWRRSNFMRCQVISLLVISCILVSSHYCDHKPIGAQRDYDQVQRPGLAI
jgi:hypothetical protein